MSYHQSPTFVVQTQLTIFKTHAQESSIVAVSSIIDLLNANGSALFSGIATSVKLILVLPATNALGENLTSVKHENLVYQPS